MKQRMILIAILLCIGNLNIISQTYEPTHKPVVYCGDSTFVIDSQLPQFTQNRLFKGWMWGSPFLISKALFCTQSDNWGNDSISGIVDSADLFVRSNSQGDLYCDHGRGKNVLMARAIQYKPSLKIPLTDINYDLIASACNGNNNNSVFGFHYLHPNVDTSGASLILDKTNNNIIGDSILSLPWKIEKLPISNGEYADTIPDTDPIQLYNGNKYFLSINVTKWGLNLSGYETDVVLKLVMTYYTNLKVGENVIQVPGVVRFEYLPKTTNTTLDDGRGIVADTIKATTMQDTVFITKEMLSSGSTPITLSAMCKFFGKQDADSNDNPRDIQGLNIKVFYAGNCTIKLNWLRLESPNARNLLRGAFDSQILANVGTSMTKFTCTNPQYNNNSGNVQAKHTNYFREIISVETGLQCWAAERYFNKLVGNIGTGATGPEMPVLYDAYVNPSDKWLELPIARIWAMVAAPYMKGYVDELDKDKTMGVIGGFDKTRINVGNGHALDTLDTLNSEYETFFRYDQNRAGFEALTNDESKLNYINFTDASSRNYSLLYYWEDKLKEAFYRKDTSGFQYSDKPWWGTNFPLNEFKNYESDGQYDYVYNYRIDRYNEIIADTISSKEKKDSALVSRTALIAKRDSQMRYYWARFYRPLTAEELRLIDYTQIIMACRGLTYDGAVCEPTYDKTQLCFNNDAYKAFESAYSSNPSSFDFESFLLSDAIGSDFVDNTCRFNTMMSKTYYLDNTDGISNKDVICRQYMGCDINRIYTGLKSHRWELYKIHKWLSENDNTLMKLKLMGSYSKGFLKMYNQHPSFPLVDSDDTIMNRYLSLKNITTRKLFQGKAYDSEHPLDSIYHTVPYDSLELKNEQFFDVTLLKYDTDDINSHQIIGLQNRRTDPLILRQLSVTPDVRKLCFYTGSELDAYADSEGGSIDPYANNPIPLALSKEYWQNIRHKQLGYREISLPIRRMADVTEQWGSVIKEYTYIFPKNIASMPYWMKDAYDHQINGFVRNTCSTIPQFDTVNIVLRPGEAKLLDIKRYWKVLNNSTVSRKLPTFPPPPLPIPLDTCELLTHGMELYFKKCDSTDANNCLYEIYYINKSDSINFYVPISAEFITDNELDTTYNIPPGFQYINIKKHGKFESIWLPDSILSDTTYLGTFKSVCDSSKVIYKLGARDCFSSDTNYLRCGICTCCDSVTVSLEPITTQIQCRLFPQPSQRITLNTGENCNYYGMIVTGGFYPNYNQLLTDLSIIPDTTNPIDLSTYNEWIADPFMFIPFGGNVTYCMHFSFLGKNGLELCNKDYCISIDTEPNPNIIEPVGIISSDCYATVPAKRSIPLEEIHSGQMIIVDPNPTSGKTNVKLNLEDDLNGRLVLYTSTGELIKEIFTGTLKKGSSDYQIDLSSQPSGMYIITIESDGMSYIKKFVKE